jgi:hypothetical protein
VARRWFGSLKKKRDFSRYQRLINLERRVKKKRDAELTLAFEVAEWLKHHSSGKWMSLLDLWKVMPKGVDVRPMQLLKMCDRLVDSGLVERAIRPGPLGEGQYCYRWKESPDEG